MKNEFGTLHNVTGRYALQFERSFSKSKKRSIPSTDKCSFL
jgi:hypothetical protein